MFILAGQSNMLGNANLSHLKQLIADPATAADYAHLINPDGSFIVRDDVTLAFRGNINKLTARYGDTFEMFGPELQFGHVVGDYFDEPVLLIKAAWGGTDLAVDWRPPSSGIPDFAYDCNSAPCQVEDYGVRYRRMVEIVNGLLSDIPGKLPEYAGLNPILSGFVWFQGFNGEFSSSRACI